MRNDMQKQSIWRRGEKGKRDQDTGDSEISGDIRADTRLTAHARHVTRRHSPRTRRSCLKSAFALTSEPTVRDQRRVTDVYVDEGGLHMPRVAETTGERSRRRQVTVERE